ncbi:MAG: DUF695 domain-containing protein [Deltaproteobacteria bacterium]|nr:DUF695 domain-containing protein [Deltaproteobacteria bacterium]MCB9786038.1 DUF695 domain-containing protein [Deltaproteobacteria bacterium]
MSYAPMFEMWRRVEDDVAYDIVLDLGHTEHFPLSDHPWFFGVRIPMATKTEDGLPTDEEAVRLNHVENRVREIVRGRDGQYVGRRTGGMNRDLVFYLPERPRGVEDRIRASVGMEILFVVREDKRWQAYESMLPVPREWRQIEDRRSIQALLNADADPGLTHRIEHRVRTSSKKGAEALVKLYEKLELDEPTITGEPRELVVAGVQLAPLQVDLIHRVSWILESKSEKAKGVYLGWTANPELSGDEPADLTDPEAELLAILESLSTGNS